MPITTKPVENQHYTIDGEPMYGNGGRYKEPNGTVQSATYIATNVASGVIYNVSTATESITANISYINNSNHQAHLLIYTSANTQLTLNATNCPNACFTMNYGKSGKGAIDAFTLGDRSVGIPLASNAGGWKFGASRPVSIEASFDRIKQGETLISWKVNYTTDGSTPMVAFGMARIMLDVKDIFSVGMNKGAGFVPHLSMFMRWQ